MPRPFLPHEQALLEGAAYQTHAQLWVEDPDGVFVDVTALAGTNWLLGFEHSFSIDQPVGSIRAELWREDAAGSLAPLMGGSPLNRNAADAYARLLNVGREFYIRNALSALGATPDPGHWWEVIRGQVDELPHGDRQSRITLVGRDLGGILLETKTEAEMTFGVAGQLMETAFQLVLDQWFPGVTLYTPVSPGKPIPPLVVAKDRPVLDVLREAASGIGHDVRYLPDASGVSRLTFYLPDRDKVTPDLTLGPGLYRNVTNLTIARRLVRNAFSVDFLNAATGQRETRTRENATSIAEYGRLWMAFTEADDSPVDSVAEADAFLEAADHDVAEPLADQEVELLYYPHIQLHDLIEFEPNDIHYDSPQLFGVVGARHRHYPKERRTWVQTTGRVVGMYREWFRRASSGAGATDVEGQITERKVGRTELEVNLTGIPGPRVAEVWPFEALVTEPFEPSEWPDITGAATSTPYSAATFLATGHTAPIPSEGQVRLVILVTKDAAGNSLWDWRYPVYPTRADPVIVDVAVTDQYLQVVGGSGVKSIRMKHRDSDWEAFYDGTGLTINVGLDDAEGEPGITGSDIWTIDINAYGVPKAEVTVGVTPSASRSITVLGPGITPGSQLEWEVVLATAPANLSETMTIRLRASSAVTTETAKLYAKSNLGTGWSAETEITALTTPAVGTAPSTNTDYTWDCGYERADADPRPRTVTFQIRAELLDGTDVLDNDWDQVAFTTGP